MFLKRSTIDAKCSALSRDLDWCRIAVSQQPELAFALRTPIVLRIEHCHVPFFHCFRTRWSVNPLACAVAEFCEQSRIRDGHQPPRQTGAEGLLIMSSKVVFQPAAMPSGSSQMGMSSKGSMVGVFARSPKTLRDTLQHVRWRRALPANTGQLWRSLAGRQVFSGGQRKVVSPIGPRLQCDADHPISDPPTLVRAQASQVRLPALCGSRPYFPAAP